MPTIKTNNGVIVLKNGKPSCTCCDGDPCAVCDPDITTLYCSWEPAGGGGPYYFEATGTLNDNIGGDCWGYFRGGWINPDDEQDNDMEISWQRGVSGAWLIDFLALIDNNPISGSDNPCDPSYQEQNSDGDLIISTVPLV